VGLVRLDATQLAWSAAEWPRLALLIAVLAAPFAAGGAVTLLAVSSEPQAAGRLYGASFAGGAAGALIALASLFVASPARALAAPALLGALAAALSEPSDLARWLPSAAPYALGAPRSALAIGGAEIESARLNGASRVVGIELHPAIAGLLGAEAGDARALVARMSERFDVV